MTATDIRVAKGLMKMSFILGQMTDRINRIEQLVTDSRPQPPRPGNRPSDLRPLTSDLRSGARS